MRAGPVAEILLVAEDRDADLIVVGSRGLGAVRGALPRNGGAVLPPLLAFETSYDPPELVRRN
jgi:hypothetical protein